MSDKRLSIFIILLLLTLVLIGCGEEVTPTPASTPTIAPSPTVAKSSTTEKPEFSDAVGQLSEMRLNAEQSVVILKSDYQAKCIQAKDFRDAQLSYGEARTAFNTWITEIVAALRDGKKLDKSLTKYNDALEKASQKGDNFVGKFEAIYDTDSAKICNNPNLGQNTAASNVKITPQAIASSTNGSKISIELIKKIPLLAIKGAGGFVVTLLSTASDLYLVYTKISAEKKEQLIKALENEKWKSFEEL